MKTYYAVCNVNGPISVELDGDTRDEALQAFGRLDTRAAIDNASTDLEDALDIDGDGLSESDFADALEAAGATLVQSLAQVHNAHAGTTAHLAGGWSLWSVKGGASGAPRPPRPGYVEHNHATEWQECDTCGLRLGPGAETPWDKTYYADDHDPRDCPRCDDGIMALPADVIALEILEQVAPDLGLQVQTEADPDTVGGLVLTEALPRETAVALCERLSSRGLQSSWAPDQEDRSMAWVYLAAQGA